MKYIASGALLLVAALSLLPLAGRFSDHSATVVFHLDLSEQPEAATWTRIGIRGSLPPLSWDETLPLSSDAASRYSVTIRFNDLEPGARLEYKFVHEAVWELEGMDNRILTIDTDSLVLEPALWDENLPIPRAQLATYRIPAADLLADITLLELALEALHPGLDRYTDPATRAAWIEALRAMSSEDRTYGEAYRAISEYVAHLRCGHTIVNPWNQPDIVKAALYQTADKLPFTFRLVDRRMIVTQSVADDPRLAPGTEILSIAGEPVPALLTRLMAAVSADGSNDGKRLNELNLSGEGPYELFDILHPLYNPPTDGLYALEARAAGEADPFSTTVRPLTRADRRDLLAARYGPAPQSYDALWEFRLLDAQTAYLKLGTFVVWQMEMDWKAFLDDAFDTLRERRVENLIVDIRGNAGGADEVVEVLLRHASSRPITVQPQRRLVRYRAVPEAIRPHVSTWDDAVYDFGSKVEPAGERLYRFKADTERATTYRPSRGAFQGRLALLVDAANSSATLGLAKLVRQNRLGTIVGQETGGNLRGINGGQMFFLSLPHSGIEVDIPIYGSYPLDPQPDSGLAPDVHVAITPENILLGQDPVLDAARALFE